MDPVLRRRRWIIHKRLEGWKIKDIATALRISEKTVDYPDQDDSSWLENILVKAKRGKIETTFRPEFAPD